MAESTIECIQRVFQPVRAAVAFSATLPGEPSLQVAAALGHPTPLANDPFLRAALEAQDIIVSDAPPAAAAPLVAAGHTMGVVALWGNTGWTLDTTGRDTLAAIAVQAAIGLQNARLYSLLSAGKIEWEQMVDAIAPAICIVDASGAVRRANRSFARLVGTPVTALTGRPWLALVPPGWAEPLGRALGASGVEQSEVRAERRIFSVTAHPVRGAGGGRVLLIEDVTETRRLHDQLIQSEKLSAIGQLIAGVAHELNNPLASVLGFADYLSELQGLPEPLTEPLRVIQQEASRAAAIVRNLLSFARRQDQDRRRLALGPVLERTLALLTNQLIGLKVEPLLAIEPGLPEIEGSPNQLQQVFLNLINNAAQAIESSGRGGTVVIRARPWLDGIAVDVEDNGPGMDEDLRARIFEPFFTTKEEGAGTGLGLSICQGIIREHNGRLTVRSSPGHGATFTVELPPADGTDPAPDAVGLLPTRRGRVLVVDDEPHILHYMRATLESWGHVVDTADDGAGALARIAKATFDVIITDVRMPGIGGRELFERLSAEQPAMAARVVFATGDTVRDDTQAFLEASGRPFLHKPFKLAELRHVLAGELSRPGG